MKKYLSRIVSCDSILIGFVEKYYYWILLSGFLILPLLPLQRKPYIQFMATLIICSFFILLYQYKKIKFDISRLKIVFCAALFFMYLFLSSFWLAKEARLEIFVAFYTIATVLIFILLFLVDFYFDKEKLYIFLYIAVILAGLFSGIALVGEYLSPGIFSKSKLADALIDRRILGYGPFVRNPISSASFISVYIYMGAALIISERYKNYQILLLGAAIVAMLCFVYFTGSRSVYLALLCAPLLVFIRQWKVMLLVGVGGTLALLFNFEHMSVRGLSFRPELWLNAFTQSLEHPFFGHGYASKIDISIPGLPQPFRQSHNLFVEVFYYGGLVGLALFFTMLYFAASSIFRSERTALGIFARLLFVSSIILVQFTAFGLRTEYSEFNYYFLLPIGLAIMLERQKSRVENSGQD